MCCGKLRAEERDTPYCQDGGGGRASGGGPAIFWSVQNKMCSGWEVWVGGMVRGCDSRYDLGV